MTIAVDFHTVPGVVRDVEVSEPLPHIPPRDATGRRVAQAWLLVRVFTEPLGLLTLDIPDAGLPASAIAKAVERRYGPTIRDRVAAAGGDPDRPFVDGLAVTARPAFLARRAEVLADAPPITVVLCTRDRPAAVATCLESLIAQEYPRFRVLVVDNAPSDAATARVVRGFAQRGPVEYLLAPEPGLSHARNVAVAAAPGEILAWIDDDELADRHWLAEIARALADHPDADVVSGVIVPAELETLPQVWFEQFGGHSKGRGFTPAVFSPASAASLGSSGARSRVKIQDPLYPLPPFGTGANMAFRPGVIERIGGFDPALGAGTPAMGSEDTLAFAQVLRGGGTIVYQPTAVTRHVHRRDLAGLRKQLVGYGVGTAAAYTALVMREPRVVFGLVRLVPTVLRDLFGRDTARTATIRADFPRDLLAGNLRGMLRGPGAYLAGRRAARRARRVG